MSMTIVEASVAERIRRHIESGEFADADAVVSRALDAMEREKNLRLVRALVAEAEASVARGEVYEMTDTFWDEVWAEADDEDRRGVPIPDYLMP